MYVLVVLMHALKSIHVVHNSKIRCLQKGIIKSLVYYTGHNRASICSNILHQKAMFTSWHNGVNLNDINTHALCSTSCMLVSDGVQRKTRNITMQCIRNMTNTSCTWFVYITQITDCHCNFISIGIGIFPYFTYFHEWPY